MTSPSDVLTGNRLREVLDARQATKDLIAEEGRMVALWRASPLADDGAGGKTTGMVAATARTAVRRFFSLSEYEPLELTATVGEHWSQKFVLIGPFGDDMMEGDYFLINNVRHTIVSIHSDQSYQVKAEGEAGV